MCEYTAKFKVGDIVKVSPDCLTGNEITCAITSAEDTSYQTCYAVLVLMSDPIQTCIGRNMWFWEDQLVAAKETND